VAQDVATVFTVLLGLAIVGGVCLLLYHYWRFALAVLLAMVLFVCWSSRAAFVGFMCVLAVMLAMLGR
jgi:hypothetical protein